MKILRLTAENVKKIRVVDISPDGSVVQITGPNGSGKSSVLDCIWFALGGTRGIDSKPVRTGSLKAKIKLDLGEIIVTRSFTREGGTSLVVEAENGARFPSPQKMLDDMLGSLTFDPLAFSRMESKAQLDVLRDMVHLDVDVDELDRLNADDYAERTDASRRVKQLEVRAANTHSFAEMPDEPVDVSRLLDEIENASDHNAAIDREADNRRKSRAEVASLYAEAVRLREEASSMVARAERLEDEASDQAEAADRRDPLPEKIDVGELRDRIEGARIVNENIEQRKLQAEIADELSDARARVDALNATMAGRTKLREEAIANADMPIDGLSFGDGEVLYNGLPFGQASSAEQLRVSVAIAMANNPKLRVLRIKDGSLLDENSLALIAEMAVENDFQCWIESVDTTGKVGIVMSDGAIVGAKDHELALVGADAE